MLNLKQILLPTDFSNGAREAALYAFEFATRFQAEVHLLHVIEDPHPFVPMFASFAPPDRAELESLARTELESWVLPDSAATATVHRVFRHGHPVTEIHSYAADHQIDLIVLGSLGQRSLNSLLLGSVAEKTVRSAPCPVLTVHPSQHRFVTESASG